MRLLLLLLVLQLLFTLSFPLPSLSASPHIVKFINSNAKQALEKLLRDYHPQNRLPPIRNFKVSRNGRIVYVTLTPSQAEFLKRLNSVVGVVPLRVRSLGIPPSPQFPGLETTNDNAGLLEESDFGSDVIIGIIDTGIWPESQSFNDRDMGPIPARWKGHCVTTPDFPITSCNRKLIGAKVFYAGYEEENGKIDESLEYRSPRDSNGHGTHTASIAAGRRVLNAASTLGYANGFAVGKAPKARIAVYKVCWNYSCHELDIIEGLYAAVDDGVDIVSLNIGGVPMSYYLDAVTIGALEAWDHGIFVSAPGGNGGPGRSTVTNVAPWVTTVGAAERDIPADVKLGNGKIVPGVSVYGGPGLAQRRMYPLAYAGTDGLSSSRCLEGSLDPNFVKGKIVLCYMGNNSRAAKGKVVKKAGGIGMILASGVFDDEGLVADFQVLPAISVRASGGDEIRRYISIASKSHSPPNATIVFKGTQLGIRPAAPSPVVASFSARGPNRESPDILKPDVVAPGVNILAAWTDKVVPSGIASDKRKTNFNILSGTSMACAHVAGLAALLKGAHPEWSPAAIRSALMTTAYTVDNRNKTMLDESTGNSATVLDFGAGHVNPQKATDPGLIYDVTTSDYVDFLCNSNYTLEDILVITGRIDDCHGAKKAGHAGNLNYPSFATVFQQYGKHKMSTHFIRTVTNVGDPNSVYKVTIRSPSGTLVTVEPEKLVFGRVGQKKNFLLRVQAVAVKLSPGRSRVKSGSIMWSDGKHTVTSPLLVTMEQPL